MSPTVNDDVPMMDARPALLATIDSLVAERDAAQEEAEHLRNRLGLSRLAEAAALAEVERLRAECAELQGAADDDTDWQNYKRVVAERDAALRERDDLGRSLDTSEASLEASIADNAVWVATVNESAAQRKAWRACADQLYNGFNKGGDMREALAEYERLKAGQ